MTTVSGELYDEKTMREVAQAYEDGEKISSIEKRLGIPKDAIAMILEETGKAPARTRRADRLTGNRVQMAHLYDHIKMQAEYISELQELLRKHKIRFPKAP